MNEAIKKTPPDETGKWVLGEERRSLVSREVRKRLPQFILEVVGSEVQYTLPPSQIPLRQTDFSALRAVLRDQLGMQFKSPQLERLLASQRPAGGGVDSIDDDTLGRILLSLDMPELIFKDGRVVIGRNEYVIVEHIRINEESVLAKVRGSSRVAEMVAQQTIEWVWRAAGMQRDWTQLQERLQLIAYGTGTRVDLGVPFHKMLHNAVLSFLEGSVVGGKKYAAYMGALPPKAAESQVANVDCVFSLDELHIFFHKFNRSSGRSEVQRLRLGVLTKDEQGSGIVIAESALDLDQHVELLSDLRDALATTS